MARLKMSVICSYSEGNLLFLLNFGDCKDEFSRAVVWDAIQLLLKPRKDLLEVGDVLKTSLGSLR